YFSHPFDERPTIYASFGRIDRCELVEVVFRAALYGRFIIPDDFPFRSRSPIERLAYVMRLREAAISGNKYMIVSLNYKRAFRHSYAPHVAFIIYLVDTVLVLQFRIVKSSRASYATLLIIDARSHIHRKH